MHQRVNAKIEEAILRLEAHYPERACFVMLSTASVRSRQTAQFRVLGGRVSFAAPLGTRHPKQIWYISALSARIVVRQRTPTQAGVRRSLIYIFAMERYVRVYVCVWVVLSGHSLPLSTDKRNRKLTNRWIFVFRIYYFLDFALF